MERRKSGFLFAERPMCWEREHSFQKAAYCYDTFLCNPNGRLTIVYWARLEFPFQTELLPDPSLDSKLRILHLSVDIDVVHTLISLASVYTFQNEEEQFWNGEPNSADYYFEIVSSDKFYKLHSNGLPKSFHSLYSEIQNLGKLAKETAGEGASYTDPKLIFANQKTFPLNPKKTALDPRGNLIIPAEIKDPPTF